MSARAARVERLLALSSRLDEAWNRARAVDDWDECERSMVRTRAVSAAIAAAVTA